MSFAQYAFMLRLRPASHSRTQLHVHAQAHLSCTPISRVPRPFKSGCSEGFEGYRRFSASNPGSRPLTKDSRVSQDREWVVDQEEGEPTTGNSTLDGRGE